VQRAAATGPPARVPRAIARRNETYEKKKQMMNSGYAPQHDAVRVQQQVPAHLLPGVDSERQLVYLQQQQAPAAGLRRPPS